MKPATVMEPGPLSQGRAIESADLRFGSVVAIAARSARWPVMNCDLARAAVVDIPAGQRVQRRKEKDFTVKMKQGNATVAGPYSALSVSAEELKKEQPCGHVVAIVEQKRSFLDSRSATDNHRVVVASKWSTSVKPTADLSETLFTTVLTA